MQRIALVLSVTVVALLIRFLMHGLLASGCGANSATHIDVGLWVALSVLCGAAVGAGAHAASHGRVPRLGRVYPIGWARGTSA